MPTLEQCTRVHLYTLAKQERRKKATSQNQYNTLWSLHSLFGLGSLLPLLNTHPTVTRNPANPFPLPTDGTSCWDLLPSVGAANDATVVGLFLFLFGFFLCSCVCHRWLLTGWFRFLSNDKNSTVFSRTSSVRFGFLRLCITGETTTLRGSSTDTAFLPLLLFSGGKRKVLTKKNVLGDDGLCSETTPVGGGPSTQTSPNDGLGIYGH